jgi:hypothetical protein
MARRHLVYLFTGCLIIHFTLNERSYCSVISTFNVISWHTAVIVIGKFQWCNSRCHTFITQNTFCYFRNIVVTVVV